MSLFTNWVANITFQGKIAQAITDVVMLDMLQAPRLDTYHTVFGGLVANQKVPYIDKISKVTKKYVSCGVGEDQNEIPTSEKTWTPNKARVWQSLCADDLENTFWVYALKRGIERNDLTRAEPVLVRFLTEMISSAAVEDAFRGVWFNDTALVNANLTGADAEYFNIYDGFWKKIFAIATANTDRRVTITENAGISYAAQDLPDNYAKTLYRDLITKSDRRLKAKTDKIILSTASLFENYLDTLESQNLESSFSILQNGIRTVARRGVTIYEIPEWDETIMANFDNGTVYDKPHRALLTTRANLAIGMDDPNAVGQLEVWFEKKEEKLHMREDYKIDVQIPFDYLIQVAY